MVEKIQNLFSSEIEAHCRQQEREDKIKGASEVKKTFVYHNVLLKLSNLHIFVSD